MDRLWLKVGGVAGIAFVVLLIVSIATSGSTPDSNASISTIQKYVTDNRGTLLLSSVATYLASMSALWFFVTLAWLVRRRDPGSPLWMLLLAASIGATMLAMFDALSLTTLALLAKQQDGLSNASVVRLLIDLYDGLFLPALGALFFGMLLAVIGIAAMRRAVAPSWLGWLSIALAVVNMISALIYETTTSDSLIFVALIGDAGFALVVLIASIYMLRADESEVAQGSLASAV